MLGLEDIMAIQKPSPYKGDLRVLFPGRMIPLTSDSSPESPHIFVYPVSIKQIGEYIDGLQELFANHVDFSKLRKLPNGSTDPSSIKDAMPKIAPMLVASLWKLIRECCTPDPEQLPHEFIELVCEAWILENFAEEKRYRPWAAMIQKLIERLFGRSISISEIISKYWSPLVIALKTSLESLDMPSMVGNFLTVGGASLSSGTGLIEPLPSDPTNDPKQSAT